jgi:hypothetical protein
MTGDSLFAVISLVCEKSLWEAMGFEVVRRTKLENVYAMSNYFLKKIKWTV